MVEAQLPKIAPIHKGHQAARMEQTSSAEEESEQTDESSKIIDKDFSSMLGDMLDDSFK